MANTWGQPSLNPFLYAKFVRHVSVRLAQLADELEGSEPQRAPSEGRALPRGSRQRAVLAIAELATPDGLGAAAIAEQAGVTQSNVYGLLERLVAGCWLELVPATEPAQWRKPT